MDFVFVDGSHAFENVLSDSRNSVAMLRDGRGIVVWHDHGEWEGVTRALDSLHLNDGAFSGLRHIRGTTLAILSVK